LEAYSDDDNGYVTPDFELPSMDEREEAAFLSAPPPSGLPPAKKRRNVEAALEDEEELALRLLQGRR
jgi:hypothetical protein